MKKLLLLTLALVTVSFVSAQTQEVNMLQKVYNWDSPSMIQFSRVISYSGDVIPYALPVVMAAYGYWGKDKYMLQAGLTIAASGILSAADTYLMKELIARPRPFDAYPELFTARMQESSYSFPSGHTTHAFNVATALVLEYPKWYIAVPSYLWATAVGFSRMNLGVHYPSDVAAGMVWGVANAFATYYIKKAIFPTKKKEEPLSALRAYDDLD